MRAHLEPKKQVVKEAHTSCKGFTKIAATAQLEENTTIINFKKIKNLVLQLHRVLNEMIFLFFNFAKTV